MRKFGRRWLNDGIQKLDIISILNDYGLVGQKITDEYVMFCPFHKDSKPSFSVKIEGANKGQWQCFSENCKKRGNIISMVKLFEDCDFETAVQILGLSTDLSKLSEELQSIEARLFKSRTQRRKQAVYKLSDLYSLNDTEPLRYLFQRGYTIEKAREIVTAFHILYCYSSDSVVFPVFNENGDIITVVERRVLGGARYKYPKGTPISEYLFNIQNILGHTTAYIVEGIFDVIRLHSLGVPSVAIFGSRISDIQCIKISKHFNKAIIAFDNDTAGENGTKLAIEKLGPLVDVGILSYPKSIKDPGDLVQFNVSKTINPSEYFAQRLHTGGCSYGEESGSAH